MPHMVQFGCLHMWLLSLSYSICFRDDACYQRSEWEAIKLSTTFKLSVGNVRAPSFILKTVSKQTKPENFHVSSKMQNNQEYSNPEQNRIDANFQRLNGKFGKKTVSEFRIQYLIKQNITFVILSF